MFRPAREHSRFGYVPLRLVASAFSLFALLLAIAVVVGMQYERRLASSRTLTRPDVSSPALMSSLALGDLLKTLAVLLFLAAVGILFFTTVDTRETIERSKKEIREKIQWFLKFADISTKADDFVESATMNPAFEELAMFENMVEMMLKKEYDVYVFDTAPTANARRLLGMSKIYSLWVDKMLRSREEARTLREMLSFTKKKEADPLLEYLLGFRQRMGQAQRLLTDAVKTAFFFVTLPEALPIAVITRFIGWFQEFGIPVGGVIVNMIIDRKALGADVPEFVLNRMQMQDEHMETIRAKFDGRVRAVVPRFDQELRGAAMLETAARALFA